MKQNLFYSLPTDMRYALAAYAKGTGRNWKAKLRNDRMSSRPEITGTLRALMNAYGDQLHLIQIPRA